MENPEERQWEDTAHQLGCPKGDEGLAIAEMMNTNNIAMTLSAISELALNNRECLLELGHGNCGHLETILEQAADIQYYGLEISSTMHEEAKNKNRHLLPSGQLNFQLYQGTELPYKAQFFNKVMSVNTIYFWQEPQKLMGEIYRVLQPGGILALSYGTDTFMKDLPFVKYGFQLYSGEKVMELADISGFKTLEIKDKKDRVMSKAGDWVDREYQVALFKKGL